MANSQSKANLESVLKFILEQAKEKSDSNDKMVSCKRSVKILMKSSAQFRVFINEGLVKEFE